MQNNYTLFDKPKTVLITGASRGIGKAIREAFEIFGLDVWAPGRDELDLSDSNAIQKFIQKTLHSGKKIDILINNAGINIINPIEQLKDEDLKTMWQVNVLAPTKLIQGFFPQMKKQNWGRIINIGSIFGIISRAERAAYSSTKAAIHGLTQATSLEGAPFGVLVNTVCPGYVNTELTRKNNTQEAIQVISTAIPMQRLAEPKEIAELVIYLSSDRNTYLTGQSIAVDGGFLCR